MDVFAPTLPAVTGRTLESSTLQVPFGSQDRAHDRSSSSSSSSSTFSVLAGLLAVLLVIAVFCILWSWNKWKKQPVPYLRVTLMPLLSLPRPRQRAKNIYDLLPRRQEELGRHQSRNIRIFSTESLLSRYSDSPSSEHASSQAGSASQVHRAPICAMGYTVGIYDNAMVPQMWRDLTPSAHYVNVGASRDCPSISSEDSRDYVNVPTTEEIAENLTSTNSSPGNLFVLPRTQKLDFGGERDEECGDASDCTSFWCPGTEDSDQLSDGEGSSQISNDYVNMSELDLRAFQGKQPWVDFQDCGDYENVPPADPKGSQHQEVEEVTFSNTDHVDSRTDGLGTHVQPVMQSGRFLGLRDNMVFQPLAQSGNVQMKHGEETSNEDSNDYENVPAAKVIGRDSEEGLGT